MLLPSYGPSRRLRTREVLRPASAALMALLLTACTGLRPSAPAPAAPASEHGASLLAGPTAVAGGAPLAEEAPSGLSSLDEAGLAALLANPGPGRLVVNFWATWCGPCVRELADLQVVAGERADVRFALVNVEAPRSRGAVLQFLATRGGGLPAYQLDTDDASGLLSRAVPAWPDIIPVTLVIDPGGAIRARFDGMMDAQALRAALAP